MRRGEEEEGASRSSTSLFALLLFIHSQFNLHKFKLPQYKRLKKRTILFFKSRGDEVKNPPKLMKTFQLPPTKFEKQL